jgi:polysaccharide export outer membrane protein
VRAGGRTLREVEAEIVDELTESGFYIDPQITVTVEEFRNQNVFVVGEVGEPGVYSVSAAMNLGDVLALAGSTLPAVRP